MSERGTPPEFDELPVDEKIEYVQRLWDRIAANPEEVPVPQWHREIVEGRLAAHRAEPDDSASWDEVREDIKGSLRKPRE